MKTNKEILGEALGEASMCWSETPKGVFDSTRAAKILEETVAKLDANENRQLHLQSMIIGLQEAMRPMLEEWSKINGEEK